jgi:hypothetical protein
MTYPLVVGPLDIFYDAILLGEIARIAESPFLCGVRPRNNIAFLAIDVVGCPAHDFSYAIGAPARLRTLESWSAPDQAIGRSLRQINASLRLLNN